MRKLFKKGFTLVELVVVVAIIAILSGVSVAVYAGITDRAKQTACDSEADTIGSVIRIAALEDADGFDFVYDSNKVDSTTPHDGYVEYDEDEDYDYDNYIHYSCQVDAEGVTFYTINEDKDDGVTDGTATLLTLATDTAGLGKVSDLLKAVYYVHENLSLKEFIGNEIEVVADNISSNKVKGFTYIADSLMECAYTFAK